MNQCQQWGAAAAAELKTLTLDLPEVGAVLASGGTSADCTDFLANLVRNEALRPQLQAILTTLNEAIAHYRNGLDAQIAETKTATDEINRLKGYSTGLETALAAKDHTGGNLWQGNFDKFTGDLKDSSGKAITPAERQEKYITWRSDINRHFVGDKHKFNTEFKKILYIMEHLGGTAISSYRTQFDTIIENEMDPEFWTWRTSEEVFSDLNKQFVTQDPARAAAIDFDNLYMLNKPYPTFIAGFTLLALKCGKTDEQKVENLRIKVSDELSAIAVNKEKPPRTDVNAWVKFYQTIWDDLEDQKHVDRLRSARPGNNHNRDTQNQPQRQNQPPAQPRQTQFQAQVAGDDPMQLDAMRSRPTREDCARLNLCYYCKKPGHILSECEERKKNNAKYGRTSQQGGQQNPQQTATQQGHRQHTPPLPRRYPSPNSYFAQWNTHQPGPPPFYQPNHFQGPVFNRLRSMDQGFVEDASTTTTGSSTPPMMDYQDIAYSGPNSQSPLSFGNQQPQAYPPSTSGNA